MSRIGITKGHARRGQRLLAVTVVALLALTGSTTPKAVALGRRRRARRAADRRGRRA
ncbi:MAG: hypothetical protein ACRDYA_01740 [Egibacteraceae bacterium]